MNPGSALSKSGWEPGWRVWSGLVLLAGLLALWMPSRWWVLVVVAPVVEEIVFRAGLQEALTQQLKQSVLGRLWSVNLITALVFAGAHWAMQHTPLAALTVLPALLLGWLYQRHRSLALCIFLHAGFNAIWLLLTQTAWLGPQSSITPLI
jgi:membrane protease YdiL (CAAX protease family)